MTDRLYPRAAPPIFPYPGHRTLAQVDQQERLQARNADLFETEENPEVCERIHRADMRRSGKLFIAALLQARAA